VTSEAKLFPIIFEGNSRAAFFRSKIRSDLIRVASSAVARNVSEPSKFPMHQNGTA
jgi:hypothetical protein